MQRLAHCGLAALATPVAAAASIFLLSGTTWGDDEVMTDLLSEDLADCGSGTAPSLLLASARRAPVDPGLTPGVCHSRWLNPVSRVGCRRGRGSAGRR